MERLGKITKVLTNFAKTSVLNLEESSEYVPGFKYIRVLNIRKFW